MMMTRRELLGTLGGGALVSALGTPALLAQGKQPQVGVVVKIGGIPWFNAMEVGIKKADQQYGANGFMIGPTQADAAQQVRAIEDLIARKVDVIGIVPNDAAALEPVCQQMGGTGRYIVYVGSLTVPLHNAWADAAIAYQKTKYPKMEMLGDRFGVAESLDDSLKTTQDQLRAHPDLKGILTFGSQGPIGAAKVLDDRGKAKQIALVGGFSPGQGEKYVMNGTIRGGYIWNPMTAGEMFIQIATLLATGKPLVDGMDLVGVGPVKIDPDKRLIQAQKLEALDRDNIKRLVALGL